MNPKRIESISCRRKVNGVEIGDSGAVKDVSHAYGNVTLACWYGYIVFEANQEKPLVIHLFGIAYGYLFQNMAVHSKVHLMP